MIKFIRLIGRQPGSSLSHEQFIQHHGSAHLALFEQCPGFLGRVQDYVQNFIRVDPQTLAPLDIPALKTDHDSLIEVWWDSVSEMQRSLSDPQYLDLVRPDETSFADVSTLLDVIAEEVPITRQPGATGPLKLFRYLKAAAGTGTAEFKRHWHESFAENLKANAAFTGCVQRYVQNHALTGDAKATDTQSDVDCVEEFWFEDSASLARLYADADWKASLHDQRLLDASRTFAIVAEEQVEATAWLGRVKETIRRSAGR